MKSVGLITEYNPFHNGHLYHARQSKKLSNADVTIALMSGQFVMRGEPAIFNKFIRAEMALEGVDLVVELPIIGSLSSSDYFAKYGILLADYLGIDTISFGSESANIEALTKIAQDIQQFETNPKYRSQINSGKSYPRVLSDHFNQHHILQTPNNILGLSYLKAIHNFAPNINAMTIERLGTYHHQSSIDHQTLASGSAIRHALNSNDALWKQVVPNHMWHLYEQPQMTKEALFPYIQYALITQSSEDLAQIYTINEGLEHRLQSLITKAHNLDSFITLVKTKRYTYTHIQRALMNIVLNIRQQDVPTNIKAARILGMTNKGQQYLKYLKAQFPERNYITNITKKTAPFFTQEIKATQLYNLCTHSTQNDFNTPVIRK